MNKPIKILILTLIAFVVCACVVVIIVSDINPKSTPTDANEIAVVQDDENNDLPKDQTPTPEPTPTIFTNDAISSNGSFNFASADVISELNDDDFPLNPASSFDYPSYTATWTTNEYGSVKIINFCDSNGNVSAISLSCGDDPNHVISNKIEEYFYKVLSMSGVQTENINLLTREMKLNNVVVGDIISATYDGVACQLGWQDENVFIKISPENCKLDTSTLPLKIDRNEDFFSDQARVDKYIEYYESCQYKELLALVDSYIAENSLLENDSAYTIKEMIEPAASVIGSCVINHDEFEESYTIFYEGIEAIGRDINFVPYTSGRGGNVIIGFRKSDWLFFDEFSIKVSSEEFITGHLDYFDVIRDTAGSGIIESVVISFDDDEIEQISDSDNPVIRFTNSEEDKHYDHELSEKEINAFIAIHAIGFLDRDLDNLLYRWKNN